MSKAALIVVSSLLLTSFAHAEDSSVARSTVTTGEAQAQNEGFVQTASYSEFLFLPKAGENSARFNYMTKREPGSIDSGQYSDGVPTRIDTDSNATDYSLHYVRTLSSAADSSVEGVESTQSATYLSFDVGYETENSSAGAQNWRSSGLQDLGFGLTHLTKHARWNLIYGANFGVAPANAVVAESNGAQGNRFTGGYSVDPMIAFETLSHTAAWGLRLRAHQAIQNQTQSSPFYRSDREVNGDVFYEVPVLPTARIGFTVGGGHGGDSSLGFKSALNQFNAGAYSRISFKNQADVLLGVTAQTHDTYSSSSTETDATIGLRKTL